MSFEHPSQSEAEAPEPIEGWQGILENNGLESLADLDETIDVLEQEVVDPETKFPFGETLEQLRHFLGLKENLYEKT